MPVRLRRSSHFVYEDIRHGTRVLINSFAVPTGQIAWNLGTTRTSEDFAAPLRQARAQFPEMERYDWVLDNRNTHCPLRSSLP